MKGPRRFVWPPLLWSLCTISGSFFLFLCGAYWVGDQSKSSFFWGAYLIGIPTLAVSLLVGLVSSLGAHLGTRLAHSGNATPATSRRAASIGAGLGAVAAGGLPFGYLLNISTVFGDPLPITLGVPLATLILFVLNGGFTYIWLCRRSMRSQNAG